MGLRALTKAADASMRRIFAVLKEFRRSTSIFLFIFLFWSCFAFFSRNARRCLLGSRDPLNEDEGDSYMRTTPSNVLPPNNFLTCALVNLIPAPMPLYSRKIIPPAYLPEEGNVFDKELITDIPGIEPVHSNESLSSCHTSIGTRPGLLISTAAS